MKNFFNKKNLYNNKIKRWFSDHFYTLITFFIGGGTTIIIFLAILQFVFGFAFF